MEHLIKFLTDRDCELTQDKSLKRTHEVNENFKIEYDYRIGEEIIHLETKSKYKENDNQLPTIFENSYIEHISNLNTRNKMIETISKLELGVYFDSLSIYKELEVTK